MVIYAHLKCNWAKDDKEDTFSYLRDFSAKLARDIQHGTTPRAEPVGSSKLEELSRLLARCYFKLGEWQFALKEEWDEVCTNQAYSGAMANVNVTAQHQGYSAVVLFGDTLRPFLVQGVAHVGVSELRGGRVPGEPAVQQDQRCPWSGAYSPYRVSRHWVLPLHIAQE